jgi:hypothetical protein
MENTESTGISRRLVVTAGVSAAAANDGPQRSPFSSPSGFIAADRKETPEDGSMNSQEQFCNSIYADQMRIAEHQLSAFIRAVTQLFGSEEAKLSAEDWLHEAERMDSPPRATIQDWRAVTIAASARLADRLAIAQHRRSDFRVDARVRPLVTPEVRSAARGMKSL